MRLATWNVNSIRMRASRVLAALKRHDIDVLAMQEIKCRNDQFPLKPFADAGYQVFVNGVNQWNGVALAVRDTLEAHEIGHQFNGAHPQPLFGSGKLEPYLEPRVLGVRVAGIEIWSLYVPNGRALDDPHFAYKLDWLASMQSHVETSLVADAGVLALYMGDFNVAPRDEDVWDMSDFEGATHVSPAEREAFASLLDPSSWRGQVTLEDNFLASRVGDGSVTVVPGSLQEVTRQFAPGWTYWDYQKARWRRQQGMKIDFALATPGLAAAVSGAFVDVEERGGEGSSDHAPVVLDI